MQTINYKGAFIHLYLDREEVRVQLNQHSVTCKTLLSGKRFVTRWLKMFGSI